MLDLCPIPLGLKCWAFRVLRLASRFAKVASAAKSDTSAPVVRRRRAKAPAMVNSSDLFVKAGKSGKCRAIMNRQLNTDK